MLSLRILTTLKNLKVGDLMIPVLNPLWLTARICENRSEYTPKV